MSFKKETQFPSNFHHFADPMFTLTQPADMMALQTITGKQQFCEEPTARNSKRLPQKGKGAVRLRSWHRGAWMRLQTIKDRMNFWVLEYSIKVDEVLLFTNFSWDLRYQLCSYEFLAQIFGMILREDPQSAGLGWRFNRPKHQEPWTFVATSRHISLNSSTGGKTYICYHIGAENVDWFQG